MTKIYIDFVWFFNTFLQWVTPFDIIINVVFLLMAGEWIGKITKVELLEFFSLSILCFWYISYYQVKKKSFKIYILSSPTSFDYFITISSHHNLTCGPFLANRVAAILNCSLLSSYYPDILMLLLCINPSGIPHCVRVKQKLLCMIH